MIARVKSLIVDAIKANGRGEITGDILQDVLLEMLTSFGGAINDVVAFLEDVKARYLSKVEDDTAQGFIEFLKGISVEELATLTQGLEVGNYSPGMLGSGASLKMKDGVSELEVDKLTVRMIATFFEIVVSKLRHINGGIVLSRGSMTCSRVVEGVDYYQCFFERGDNNEIANTLVVNDQARDRKSVV